MTVVLTICSANYLAHAKALGDSVKKHNPDCHFVIGLVDKVPKEVNESFWAPFELIPVEAVQIPQFSELLQKYNIIELNTAVKPFYMEYLFERDEKVSTVIYLDPDVLVYGSFNALNEKLKKVNIIVTPHSCTYDDSPSNIHYETVMLWTGVFNLGFIATGRSAETRAFLKWWQIRLRDHCYRKKEIPGSFYDQAWIGLAPIYFPGLYVEKDPGYNLCYWNHFERRLSLENGKHVVNGRHDLIFLHFSGYKPEKPGRSCARLSEPVLSFDERPDLRPIYDDYGAKLLAANYKSIKTLPWGYARPEEHSFKRSVKTFVKKTVLGAIGLIPAFARKRMQRFAQFVAQKS